MSTIRTYSWRRLGLRRVCRACQTTAALLRPPRPRAAHRRQFHTSPRTPADEALATAKPGFFALSNKWLSMYFGAAENKGAAAAAAAAAAGAYGHEGVHNTEEYYRSRAEVDVNGLDRALLRSLLQTRSTTSGIGDLVECVPVRRQGHFAAPVCGVVIDEPAAESWGLVYTLDGALVRYLKHHVHLRIPRVFNPDLVHQAFHETTTPAKLQIQALLRLVVKSSFDVLDKVQDALVTVHSHVSRPAGLGPPTAHSVDSIAERACALARVRDTASSRLVKVSAVLATHVYLTNNPVYWWRLDSTAQWLALPATAAEENQHVVAELGPADYAEYGQFLASRFQTSQDNDMEDHFWALTGFLKRYILYPHASFKPLITSILHSAYPHRDRATVTASPAQVRQLLDDAGLVSCANPVIDSGLFYNRENGNLTDGFSKVASVVASKSAASSAPERTAHRPLPSRLRVFALSSQGRDPELAVSLDQSSPRRWKLSVHVPDLSATYSPRSSFMSLALRRAQTLDLPEGRLRLVPSDIAKQVACFEDGDKPTKCMTFSVKFNPWKPTEWGMHDVDVTLDEVHTATTVNVEQLAPLSGWNSSTPPNKRIHVSLRKDYLDDVFEQDEPEQRLESLESLELGDDLDGGSFDAQESPMRFTRTDSDLDEEDLQGRLSLFSDALNRNDRNLLTAINETVLKNFWQRMDAGGIFHTEQEKAKSAGRFNFGAIDLTSDGSHVGHFDLAPRKPAANRMLEELEILAGQIGALYGAKAGLALPYERQYTKQHAPDLKPVIDQSRAHDGSLSASGAYLASQYLSPSSLTAAPRHPHYGLGVAGGFVGVTKPFDDITHALAQWQLAAHVTSSQCGWQALSTLDVTGVLATTTAGRQAVVRAVESRTTRYWALRWLEHELTRSAGYFVFKCLIADHKTEYPDHALAYCVELGILVDIALTPATPQVEPGDRVMCTGILALDPITGTLVLGL